MIINTSKVELTKLEKLIQQAQDFNTSLLELVKADDNNFDQLLKAANELEVVLMRLLMLQAFTISKNNGEQV